MFIQVRFQVLTVARMIVAVFWDVAPCSLVEIDLRFRGAYSKTIACCKLLQKASELEWFFWHLTKSEFYLK
jgi:hypothetical protein